MSKTTAQIVLQSVDIHDSEEHAEALYTLAQAELEGETEWEEDIFPF